MFMGSWIDPLRITVVAFVLGSCRPGACERLLTLGERVLTLCLLRVSSGIVRADDYWRLECTGGAR